MNGRGTLLMPREYLEIEDEELVEKIRRRQKVIGNRMILLAHHYQRDEIVEMADFVGDSFYLSKMASMQENAELIVFCGVHFMAESADILSSEGQTVLHPDLTAGCPMADMADIVEVEEAWDSLKQNGGGDFVPVTYMNSDAELKAFCGRLGGSVCTSSNASAIFDWIMDQGKRIFFFPDEHLGRNIAHQKGVGAGDVALWDAGKELGGNSQDTLRAARIVVWKGFCHVHTRFKPMHIEAAREKYPDATIVVHPECVFEVASAADAFGSTEYISRFVNEASPGSTILVGTEIHLVNRLAKNNPDKNILPLARSLCPNMYKVSLNDLLWTLDRPGEINIVSVPADVKRDARKALETMLRIT